MCALHTCASAFNSRWHFIEIHVDEYEMCANDKRKYSSYIACIEHKIFIFVLLSISVIVWHSHRHTRTREYVPCGLSLCRFVNCSGSVLYIVIIGLLVRARAHTQYTTFARFTIFPLCIYLFNVSKYRKYLLKMHPSRSEMRRKWTTQKTSFFIPVFIWSLAPRPYLNISFFKIVCARTGMCVVFLLTEDDEKRLLNLNKYDFCLRSFHFCCCCCRWSPLFVSSLEAHIFHQLSLDAYWVLIILFGVTLNYNKQ